MTVTTMATILIVPGLRDHVADHWQTLLEAKLRAAQIKVTSVPPLEHDKLSCSARVEAIQKAISQIDGPVILVAHSGGVIMVSHWAQKYQRAIHGALLAAPPDFETPLPAGYPTLDVLKESGWLPTPRTRLPFRTIVAASTNDPLGSYAAIERLATDWGSELVNIGAVGHLNPAAGYGDWPPALDFVAELAK